MRKLRWPVASAAVMTALLATGCGSGAGTGASATSSPTAVSTPTLTRPPAMPVLRKEVLSAIRHAKSVHVVGSVVPKGSSKSVSLDLSMTRSGHMSGSFAENKASIKVLVTAAHSYFKVSGAFLKLMNEPSAACSLLCGKWLILPAKDAQGFTRAMSWAHIVGSVTSGMSSHTLTYRGRATVNGEAAWKLVSSDGTRAYVAAEGVPYLLRVIPPPGVAGHAEFTQWNTATIAPTPPANEVVNLNQLVSG